TILKYHSDTILLDTSFFIFYCSGDHRDLHSFPTRRSSDLGAPSPTVLRFTVFDAAQSHQGAYAPALAGPRTLDPLNHTSRQRARDRKSTRLNSSHVAISYAVFCLKKKNSSTPCTVIM